MSIANLGAKVLKEIFTEGLDETTEALGKSAVRNVDTKKIDIDNTDDYVYIAHGGADFEGSPSLAMSGTGEAASTSLMGGFNPLGKGTYGYLIEPEGLEEAVRAIKQNQSYGKKYGTRQSRDPKFDEEEELEGVMLKEIRKKHNFEVEKLSKTKKDSKDFLSQVEDYKNYGPDKWIENSSFLRELHPVLDPDVIKLDKKLTKELDNFFDGMPSRYVASEFKYPEFDVAGKVHLFRLKKSDIDAATKAAKKDKTGKLKGLMRQERLPVDLTEVAIKNPKLLESLGKLDLDADETSINTFLKGIFKLPDIKPIDALGIGTDSVLESGIALKNYNLDTIKKITEASSAATAGNKKADKLINKSIPSFTKVGVRLNLNSSIPNMPKGLDKLQTLHERSYNGKVLSYVPYAALSDVTFSVNQKGRTSIAAKRKGIDTPEAKQKYPAMSVDGSYEPNYVDSFRFDIDEFTEVGFNPIDYHLFVDLNTGQAVKGANYAVVLGDRVYAKGIKYWKKTKAPEPIPTKTGVNLDSKVRFKLNKGGLVQRPNR